MRTTLATAVLLLLCTVSLLVAQTGDEIFRQARQKEVVDGDIPAAIQLYERVVRDFPSNRPLVAQSLFQLGECYERINQPAKSLENFQRIVDQFKDQIDTYNRAMARLNELLRNRPGRTGGVPVPVTLPPDAKAISTSFSDDPYGFAISPDGKSLVYQAIHEGKSQLWLRQLDTGQARPLPGTNTSALNLQSGGSSPFFSPDGRSIGFFADAKLKTVNIATGAVRILADAPTPRGGAWGGDTIVYSPLSTYGPLYRVPVSSGGVPVPATRLTSGRNHRDPFFLADGRRFVFCAVGGAGPTLGSLENLDAQSITLNSCAAGVATPDVVMTITGGTVWAQRIDTQGLEPLPTSFAVGGGIAGNFRPAFSASSAGPLAYRSSVGVTHEMFWLDRAGRRVKQVGAATSPNHIRISSDGQTLVHTNGFTASGISVRSGARVESTTAGTGSSSPVWSPDGSRIAWGSQEGPQDSLYANIVLRERGGTATVRLLASQEHKYPSDWSKDGSLLFQRVNLATGYDLFVLPLRGIEPAGDPIPVAVTSADERNGRFSPDGRWIAYEATEGNGYDVYVQAFPGAAASRKKISTAGGTNVEWGRNGREIYFLSRDYRLMVAGVTVSADGRDITITRPAPLFQDPLPDGSEFTTIDGEQFLVNAPVEASSPPIIVLSDWNRGKQ